MEIQSNSRPQTEAELRRLLLIAKSEEESAKERRRSIEVVLGMIAPNSTSEPEPTDIGTSRYRGMGMTQAVYDCLKNFAGHRGLTRAEVVDLMKKNGFVYGGDDKNFYSSVSITLRRLYQQANIDRARGNGVMRFLAISAAGGR